MKKVRITPLRQVCHGDLSEKYENKLETPCEIEIGKIYYSCGAQKPDGFCESAWETLAPFVTELAAGGGNFYNGWMKDPHTALLSCNDGFRPVSFLLEAVEKGNE